MTRKALSRATRSDKSGLPEDRLGRWRESPSRTRLRLHRLSTLVVVAVVVLGFGGLRLVRDLSQTSRSVSGGVETIGVRSNVSIGTDGSLRVVQRLTFAKPRSSLTVSIPIRSAPDNLFDPRIDDLRLHAEAQDSTARLTGTLTKGEVYTFRLPAPAESAELSYSAEGVTSHARPSVAGRVLTLITPLSIDDTTGLTSRIEIDGRGVLNVGCRQARRPMTTCGTGSAKGWVVERGADDPVDVFAQVNLPATP